MGLQAAVSDVLGRTAAVEGVPFGTDAGLLSVVGKTPTVLFGAGDIRHAHRPDEYVEIEELVEMARVLGVATMRFCSSRGIS
jgi:acetylornithine deacetylase